MNIFLTAETPYVTIGETFKVSSGGTPSRKKIEYFNNGDIPWVKTGDLKGKYANHPTEYLTELVLILISLDRFLIT